MSQRDASTYLENLQRVLEDETGKYTYRLGQVPECSEVVSTRHTIVSGVIVPASKKA